MGDHRPPSPLGDIQPDYWLAEYTTELLNVLNVLGLLVDLEPSLAKLNCWRRYAPGRNSWAHRALLRFPRKSNRRSKGFRDQTCSEVGVIERVSSA
jgi:hypothetical protein